MRAFVLSTGKCGSMIFSKTCGHFENFTSGHETRWGVRPPARLDFPDQHIEVDNRLSWHLGELAARYPDALYVHLHRDPEAVAGSLLNRWHAHLLRR